MPTSRKSQPAESNTCEEIGDAGGRVCADLALLLADDVEQAVKRLADDILIDMGRCLRMSSN